jgi:hypothetical protein
MCWTEASAGKGRIIMRLPVANYSLGKKQFLPLCLAILCILQSCKMHDNPQSAFYYWKSDFNLNTQRSVILKAVANDDLYLRFFDITWNDETHEPQPDAIISFSQPVDKFSITPVVFIANKTFEQIADTAINTLAAHTNVLIIHIAAKANIRYENIQFDCDWTLTTRDKYFNILKALKKLSNRHLQATIRLHQVKYKERTGIPPVDKGVLMFYNMGTLNNNLQQPNSIYNPGDAQKYIAYIPQYPLKLDVALPLFSWAIQIREGRLVQLYNNPNKSDFHQTQNFINDKGAFRAKKSFFLNGVYIKQNDIFKLEQTDVNSLKKAAGQLSAFLPAQQNRTIIYYELGNLNLSEFNAEAINQVSAHL